MAENRGLLKTRVMPAHCHAEQYFRVDQTGFPYSCGNTGAVRRPPTVTYIDAFLRMTVVPQITADNTIFLSVDVENTVPDFSRVSGQQLNPTLNTQQATTQVLVSHGGTVVIGGVIQTQNSVAIAQVPLSAAFPYWATCSSTA